MNQLDLDRWHMARAIALAQQGRGRVEPNPLVGCLVARGAEIVGEGWHRRFGGPHAEVEALAIAASRARGATLYVTLEPCCHHGKTPPCTDAVAASGVRRVVAAMEDPFPAVAGGGLRLLREQGVETSVGVLSEEAQRLNAPYLKLLRTGLPWVIAKWAMTLDGKLATRGGDARWISCEASRALAHEWRGQLDAIVVGRGTVEADDPLLTARPPGPRAPLRVVLDRAARMPLESKLLSTLDEAPVLLAVGPDAPESRVDALRRAGAEAWQGRQIERGAALRELLTELGRRRLTNVLVEGGATVLGALFDARLVDEARVFVAPRLAGGGEALSAVAGVGVERMSEALRLGDVAWRQVGDDLLLTGRVAAP